MDKFADIYELDDQKRINSALLTSRSAVEDFIRRWKVGTPAVQQTWANLSTELLNHFGQVSDREHALALLRRLKQGPNEHISLFAERIFRLSQDAYTRAEMNDAGSYAMAQRQLVNCFIDGINDRSIKLKIMRQMPPDLNTALNLARTEINLLKRFELRHGSFSNSPSRSGVEPMDINYIRNKSCHNCGQTGHLAKQCRVTRSQVPNNQRCLLCSSRDHKTENCRPSQQRRRAVNVVDQPQRRVCYLCGSPSHFIRDCPNNTSTRNRFENNRNNGPTRYQSKNQSGIHQ